jgi:hypothetical protein
VAAAAGWIPAMEKSRAVETKPVREKRSSIQG